MNRYEPWDRKAEWAAEYGDDGELIALIRIADARGMTPGVNLPCQSGDHHPARCWCRTARYRECPAPPPEPPGPAERYRPPRWIAVLAMLMTLLTAGACAAVALYAIVRAVA